MKKLCSVVSFVVGLAILAYGFGIAYAEWWEFAERWALARILLAALGIVVAFLATIGVLGRNRDRWIPMSLTAILLLGFSALTFFSLGVYLAPFALLLLGFSIWKLVHHHAKHTRLLSR